MQTEPAQLVPVWDIATRLFHWSLVVLVAINLLLGGKDPGLSFVVHVVAGYLVGLLLLYRLVWGLIGSPHSRFADFIASWPVVKAYAGRLIRFDPPRFVGHNPLGGWMVVLLLATLGFIVFSGLFGAGRETSGPLAASLPQFLAHLFGELHELASDVLWALIGIHVAGVLVDWLLTRENIVLAMVKGDKLLAPAAAAAEPPLVGRFRAIALAVVMIALFGAAVARTDFGSLSHPQTGRQSSLTSD